MDSLPSHSSSNPGSVGRFSFLTTVLVIALLMFCAVLVVIKLGQDRMRVAALRELGAMGFDISISSSADGGPVAQLVAWHAKISPDEASRLADTLEILTRRHDLGFSPGLEIEHVGLAGTGVSKEVVTELRRRFPKARIVD